MQWLVVWLIHSFCTLLKPRADAFERLVAGQAKCNIPETSRFGWGEMGVFRTWDAYGNAILPLEQM
jgi:hypothetical protein